MGLVDPPPLGCSKKPALGRVKGLFNLVHTHIYIEAGTSHWTERHHWRSILSGGTVDVEGRYEEGRNRRHWTTATLERMDQHSLMA